MAFRIKTSLGEIEVDSYPEFDYVFNRLQGLNGERPSNLTEPAKRQYVRRPKRPKPTFKQHDYKSFIILLDNTRQGQILRIIGEKPEGVTDTELRNKMGLSNNLGIAGIIGVMSRNAKKFGFKFDEILHSTQKVTTINGKLTRTYLYKLTKEMMEAMPTKLA